MTKGGLADSPFFHLPQQGTGEDPAPLPHEKSAGEAPAATPGVAHESTAAPAQDRRKKTGKSGGKPAQKGDNHAKRARHRDTTTPRYHDTTVPRYHDTIIELVRRAVKAFGKEAATHRFTQEEKKAIADLIYTYKSRGIRTSENEITRVAVNFIVTDFRENGEASVLNRVLSALNA